MLVSSSHQELLRCLFLFLPLHRITCSSAQTNIKHPSWFMTKDCLDVFASSERMKRFVKFFQDEQCFVRSDEDAAEYGFVRCRWSVLLEGIEACLTVSARKPEECPPAERTKLFSRCMTWTDFYTTGEEIKAAAAGALALADLRMTTLARCLRMYRLADVDDA